MKSDFCIFRTDELATYEQVGVGVSVFKKEIAAKRICGEITHKLAISYVLNHCVVHKSSLRPFSRKSNFILLMSWLQ